MYTLPFSKLDKTNVNIAGGKGASLGELMNAGFPVPAGFVVLANVSTMGTPMPQSVQAAILAAFDDLGADQVAVRSSATVEDSAQASWAGELETFLNTTRENLISNIEACWASLSSPRAMTYREEQGLQHTPISVAVVVQKMVQSDVSGVAFSVHPVSEHPNQMIIEAASGMGDKIVSGDVTPDAYIIDKQGLSVVDKGIASGGKEIFTTQQLKRLAKMVLDIEKHFGFPCDIEWAMAKGKFYILQSRPITTLNQ